MNRNELGALALLGVFHGINPGMGWLFAVSIGLQNRSRGALLKSLVPIAAGHEASVAVLAVAITVTNSEVASKTLLLAGGSLLVAFGLWRLFSKRHLRWVGMRLSMWQLAGWSFAMSAVHGAGLMLLPVLTFPDDSAHLLTLGHGGLAGSALTGLVAAGVHSIAMIVTTGSVALLVYETLGLSFLRRAWFNLDRVWAVALIGAGVATLTIG